MFGFTYSFNTGICIKASVKQGNDGDRLYKDHLIYSEYLMRIPHTSRPCVPAQRKTDSEVESGLAMEPETIFFYTITLSFSATNLKYFL